LQAISQFRALTEEDIERDGK